MTNVIVSEPADADTADILANLIAEAGKAVAIRFSRDVDRAYSR